MTQFRIWQGDTHNALLSPKWGLEWGSWPPCGRSFQINLKLPVGGSISDPVLFVVDQAAVHLHSQTELNKMLTKMTILQWIAYFTHPQASQTHKQGERCPDTHTHTSPQVYCYQCGTWHCNRHTHCTIHCTILSAGTPQSEDDIFAVTVELSTTVQSLAYNRMVKQTYLIAVEQIENANTHSNKTIN